MKSRRVKEDKRTLPAVNKVNLRNPIADQVAQDRQVPDRGRKSVPATGLSTIGDRATTNRSRRSAFMRTLSRSKSKHIDEDNNEETDVKDRTKIKTEKSLTRALSRRRSVCNKLTRQKSQPKYGSRATTGPISLQAKERVLLKYPSLVISEEDGGDKAQELVSHGANSIKAEMIDMNTMIQLMEDNVRMLTHTAVERFFEWIPLFALYLERYMIVEEDLIFRWIEAKGGTMRGDLSPAQRMMSRGKIQRELQEVVETQDCFVRHVPSGQRLSLLSAKVEVLTNDIVTFFDTACNLLPPILRQRCTKSEISKSRSRIVKHVVEHVGYQDFLALYTRWMPAGVLLEWKTSVLLPCDFKFFSYSTWEKDMDHAHYQIAAGFGERLKEETKADEEANKQSKLDFERARQTRLQLMEQGVDAEIAEEEEFGSDQEDDDEN